MNTEKIKVLFVDDEEANLTAYKRNYRRELQVFQAISADEALKILSEETIDVIVSDQRMPNMTGVEFLAKVKMHSPATMRILVTGYSDIEAVIAAINQAGVFNYITKPYTPEELLSQITQAHDICRTRRAMERLEIQYEQLLQYNQDPILVFNEAGNIEEFNRAALELFAIDANSMSKESIAIVGQSHNDLFDRIRSAANDGNTIKAAPITAGLGRFIEADLLCSAIRTPGVHEAHYMVQIAIPRENVFETTRAA